MEEKKLRCNIIYYLYLNYSVDDYLRYWYELTKKLGTDSDILINNTIEKNPMNLKDIATYLDIPTKTCKGFIKESIELGVLYKKSLKINAKNKIVFMLQNQDTVIFI